MNHKIANCMVDLKRLGREVSSETAIGQAPSDS
jgi:hypothetical protein